MDVIKITSLIKNPQDITENDVDNLEKITQDQPFFSTSHLLIAKGLLNARSYKYNKKLKIAAAYSGNRKLLFKLITKNPTITISKNKEEEITKNQDLEIGKPLNFNKKEEYSFSEWLAITNIQKINRKEMSNSEEIIENFIKKEPTINSISSEKRSVSKEAEDSLIENKELVTETLARVYLEQSYYEKAIETYKKLILKYPKKSGFFAGQINLVNDLKKDK